MRGLLPVVTLFAAGLFLFSPKGVTAASIVVREYRGSLDMHGHYPVPHETRRYESKIRALGDQWGRLRLEWTTRDTGDSMSSTEVTLVRGDSVFVLGSSGRWRLLAGEREIEARMQALAPFPEVVANYFSGFRFRGATTKDVDGTFAYDLHGRDWHLKKDDELRVTAMIRPRAHPRLGDVDDRVDYVYAEEPEAQREEEEEKSATMRDRQGETDRETLEKEEEAEEARRVIPHEFTITIHERDGDWSSTMEELFAGRVSMPDTLFRAPREFDPPPPDENALPGSVEFTDVAPGLVLASMADVESRSMIAEFADSLIVMECSVSSANGERLADAIAKRWPDKPIRWFLFSHHHPHYLGGLRGMVAAGAGVGTTPGNEAYVREIVAWPFTRSPDRLAQHPVPLKIRTSADRLEFADATNHLIALNFGSRWQHTKEALVFWFPKQKVLFETEQGWFTQDGKLTASRRATGLLKLLDDEQWDVDQIAQSWPMEGTEAIVTRAKLEELVAARGK